jgi:hypothetical protein
MHELQHGIEHLEGFAYAERPKPGAFDLKSYMARPGEAEAREVGYRMNWPRQDQEHTPPWRDPDHEKRPLYGHPELEGKDYNWSGAQSFGELAGPWPDEPFSQEKYSAPGNPVSRFFSPLRNFMLNGKQ